MSDAQQKVNVICIKWGDKYGNDYVNTLYSMVSRNLSLPYRFVCFTDEAEGIRDEVEVKPIPKIKPSRLRREESMGESAWVVEVNVFCESSL